MFIARSDIFQREMLASVSGCTRCTRSTCSCVELILLHHCVQPAPPACRYWNPGRRLLAGGGQPSRYSHVLLRKVSSSEFAPLEQIVGGSLLLFLLLGVLKGGIAHGEAVHTKACFCA
ncbi:hypothetical protein BU25DRAFT_255273 [Macroventuria anomochaeta]|uniref:Uncharacterized protein n=1 Tax=Macroventuria anomochaeta TaxID=301207 RepID=A0ACB6S8H6_9PLEO|nr:uncharacterized protein BU25DRAFT_255273 [Macroventuria anomochaeta]KAF2630268.1 hypothetical protein BU25DRAFT_255273 [Macroventuria anomochaeta]